MGKSPLAIPEEEKVNFVVPAKSDQRIGANLANLPDNVFYIN
jgi:hypothetical protein